jgi:recombination protein RecT
MTDMTTTAGPGVMKRTGAGDLKSFLDSPAVRAKLAEAAGAAMKPEDLIRLTLVAASRSPDLVKCSRESILRSLMDAAALGIKPGGLMGRGYLVPRKNKKNGTVECCFDPGWRGLVDIARRSGQIRRIEAHAVFEKDIFTVERTPLTTVRHVPSEDPSPGQVRAAYAVAEFTGGEVQIEVLYRRDLDKIRRMGADNGPWSTWYDEMARKTAVRRLCKYLPYDPHVDEAMRIMDEQDGDVEAALRTEDSPRVASIKKLTAKLQGASVLPPVEPADLDELDEPEIDPETGEVVPPAREPGEEG